MVGSDVLRAAVVGLSISGSALLAAEAPANASPFLPPAGAAAAPAAEGPAAYSLGGMTIVGQDTLLSITREKDKRSTWIPVGKTVGEITVLSYDPKKDEAIVEAEGRKLTLTMRKAAPVTPSAARAAQPTPAAAPVATAPAVPAPAAEVKMPPLNQQEEKEMEARMLVSDLLEIGQQQRKAYEAAQRAAAEEKAKKTQSAEAR